MDKTLWFAIFAITAFLCAAIGKAGDQSINFKKYLGLWLVSLEALYILFLIFIFICRWISKGVDKLF